MEGLWYAVQMWAIDNGYNIAKAGREENNSSKGIYRGRDFQ